MEIAISLRIKSPNLAVIENSTWDYAFAAKRGEVLFYTFSKFK